MCGKGWSFWGKYVLEFCLLLCFLCDFFVIFIWVLFVFFNIIFVVRGGDRGCVGSV